MDTIRSQHEDEIDLIEVVLTLWRGKFKILAITSLFVLLAVYLYFSSPNKFVATSEIKPVTSDEIAKYSASNSLGFFEVTKSRLLNLYIEQLDTRELFIKAFHEVGLLDKEGYLTEDEYNEAVIAYAADVVLLPPDAEEDEETGEIQRYWRIVFAYDDQEQWAQVLAFIKSEVNEYVRQELLRSFNTALNVAETLKKFQLEDLELQMSNSLEDYDRNVSDRLAYLKEQAAIARKLDIAKNTIEAQTFSSQSGLVASVQVETPFYFRGYEAIEKEMELIESRESKEAFVSGLVDLERKQRSILQDRKLERAKALLDLTPLQSAQNFQAVSFIAEATDYTYSNTKKRLFVLIVLAGGMFGMLYVLISSAIKKRSSP